MDRKEPTENQVMILLEQVNHLCPKCGNVTLKIKPNSKIYKHFQIAHVFPNSPTDREKVELKDVPVLGDNSETIENWIPLCRDCHDEYDNEKTRGMYMEMYALKKRIMAETSAKHALAEGEIEEELVQVIKALGNMTPKDFEGIGEMPLEVLTIKEKIPDSEFVLRNKVTNNVTNYFPFIEKIFKSIGVSTSKYEIIRSEIRGAYYKALDKQLSVGSIFDNLVNWLMSKVQAKRESCEVIISYYIQNCDIYGKNAE